MSSFTDPLMVLVEQGERDGRGLARVIGPFRYHVGAEGSDDIVSIPFGYLTDFASIPWFARAFIPVMGRHAKAAVVHDYLIDQGFRPRREVDKIFLEAMKVLGVGRVRRTIMYLAVSFRTLTTGLFGKQGGYVLTAGT